MRGTFIEAHISDIHFGAFDPKVQLQILNEQFIQKIKDLPLSIVSINGDLFDRKFMANSEAITCASMFIASLVDICRYKNATLFIIHGTESHDAHHVRFERPRGRYGQGPCGDLRQAAGCGLQRRQLAAVRRHAARDPQRDRERESLGGYERLRPGYGGGTRTAAGQTRRARRAGDGHFLHGRRRLVGEIHGPYRQFLGRKTEK